MAICSLLIEDLFLVIRYMSLRQLYILFVLECYLCSPSYNKDKLIVRELRVTMDNLS